MTAPVSGGVVAFVAGATGFVGRALVPALVGRGARVIAHVRPDSGQLDEWRQRFAAAGAEIDTSPWQADAMGRALAAARVSHAFCLIGTTRKRASAEGVEGDRYQAIDYGLTRVLVDAAVASAARPRLVYLSSVGASQAARSAYLAARWQAEEAVRGAGLPWVIARPSFITGPGREDARPVERAAGAVADGVLAAVGLFARRTRDRYRSTTPEVLAAALVRLGLDGPADRVVESEDLH